MPPLLRILSASTLAAAAVFACSRQADSQPHDPSAPAQTVTEAERRWTARSGLLTTDIPRSQRVPDDENAALVYAAAQASLAEAIGYDGVGSLGEEEVFDNIESLRPILESCAEALALAELSQASHKSALVFDDPVSSLDHKRREEIAKRLVREAEVRQVIVFTHDLAFVCDLDSAARSASRPIHYQHIEWLAGKPGRVLPGLMWDAQTYKAQIKTLNEQIRHADIVCKTRGDSEYREAAMPVIGRLRGACERVIEQHLLNSVIKRHDSRIDVRNTPSLAVVTADQWKSVHAIWKTCSNIIESHANPLSGPVNIPRPNQLMTWMKELEMTVEDVKKARESSGTSEQPCR